MQDWHKTSINFEPYENKKILNPFSWEDFLSIK